MEDRVFEKKLLELALSHGCEAAETYSAKSDSFEATVLNGELDRYAVSTQGGLSLRVQVNGKNGYAYTEHPEDPVALVQRAMENARAIEIADEHPMQGRCTYQTVQTTQGALSKLSEQEKIDLAKRMEKTALAADPRVKRVSYCEVGSSTGSIGIYNTLGLSAERTDGMDYCYVQPILEQDGEVRTGLVFRSGTDAADVEGCAREAVAEAAEKFGAEPVPSGAYRVILRNTAMADLMEAFLGMFSADEAQKGCSLLANREGEKIADEKITIFDDPFHPIAPRAFDDEGTPCYKKALVENGVLKTLLHNLKTAKKAGVASTGNGVRPSAASAVGVGASVLCIAPGKQSLRALTEEMGDGLIITELEGLHAGLDAISGDFSLKAAGQRVENGQVTGSVAQITLAGNFLAMLQNVIAVGSDMKFTLPSGTYSASPSILFDKLNVAGK